MVRIAMIDDGINTAVIPDQMSFLSYQTEHGKMLEYLEVKDITHGTLCAHIITSYVKECELVSIKILDSITKKANMEDLIFALNWCIHNDIQLINLSLGSRQYWDTENLQVTLDNIIKNNMLIIASCNNQNTLTYPASARNVIGVRADKMNYLEENTYTFQRNPVDGIDISVYTETKTVKVNGSLGQINFSNSYAAPFITARVCTYINEGNGTIAGILERLEADAAASMPFQTFDYYQRHLLWEDKITVPIIVCLNNDFEYLRRLNALFLHEGYASVFINPVNAYNCAAREFYNELYKELKISFYEMLLLYYNLTSADQMIVCSDLITIEVFKDSIDIILYSDSVCRGERQNWEAEWIEVSDCQADLGTIKNSEEIFRQITCILGKCIV